MNANFFRSGQKMARTGSLHTRTRPRFQPLPILALPVNGGMASEPISGLGVPPPEVLPLRAKCSVVALPLGQHALNIQRVRQGLGNLRGFQVGHPNEFGGVHVPGSQQEVVDGEQDQGRPFAGIEEGEDGGCFEHGGSSGQN